MHKKPARKLKVFQAHFGFWDTVVAAPSQAAALRIWGTTQNLFAQGEAKVATDEMAINAALAQPETLLRRAIGSNGKFALKPSGFPSLPKAERRPAARQSTRATLKPKPKPADRSRLDAAEVELRELDMRHKEEVAAFRQRSEELERSRSAAQSAYITSRKAATARVVKERQAFRRASGVD